MAKYFRFRSINALLGENYQELKNQTIYFASPEELNDPMEGFRDMVWRGDKIVWNNFFKHYVYCLHESYMMFRIAGDSIELDRDNIPILRGWDQFPTPQAKTLFEDNWRKFLNLPNIHKIIETIANTKRKIRYREIGYFLQTIHDIVLEKIRQTHIDHGLMSESEIENVSVELGTATLEMLLNSIEQYEKVENEKQLDAIFQINEANFDKIRLNLHYNTQKILTEIGRKNYQLVIFDFPIVYVEQLEKLLWSKWYTACFTKSYHNSSMWGIYGDSHKGVCLIFEDAKTDKSNSLELNQTTGSRNRIIPFYDIRYADIPGEIDFFRTICRLPVSTLKKLWYTDQNGNISECAAHIGSDDDEAAWQKSYWESFFRDITIKTTDWADEQEYRLILSDKLGVFNKKEDRLLTYDFNSLKGIIFGMKTSSEDKIQIIEIIQRKCKENKRTDFKFFQAYYSAENGNIRKYPTLRTCFNKF